MINISLSRPTLVLVLSLVGAASVAAQPLGAFRWQQQPYCNVLTLTVVQDGGVYHLDGFDDQCGAATRAAVVGLAFPNPDGTIGMGVTLVTTPGGTPLHIDATITLPSVSGSWRDSAGNTGAFVLTPGAAAPGSVRPVPRASFPAGLSAGGTTITNVAAPVAGTDAATKAYVDGVAATKPNTADVRAAMIGEKTWKAIINGNGTKGTTGPYTSSTSGVGAYSVAFDVTGLGISPATFGVFVATPVFCPGGSATIGSRNTVANSGGLTSFGAAIAVADAAGAPVNCQVAVYAAMPDADLPGSPIPPLVAGSNRPGVTCAIEGDLTTCIQGPLPK